MKILLKDPMCTYHAFAVASLATISHAIERESERVFLSVGTYKMRHPYMRVKSRGADASNPQGGQTYCIELPLILHLFTM